MNLILTTNDGGVMKLLVLSMLLLLLPTRVFAQSVFDGTWAVEPRDVAPGKLDITQELLLDGRYSCPTCVPQIDVIADGTDQRVADQSRWDTIAVTVVDDRTVRFTYKVGGKVTAEREQTVVQGGNEVTETFFGSNGNVKGKGRLVRVDSTGRLVRTDTTSEGGHALSGFWLRPGILMDMAMDGNIRQMDWSNVRTWTFQSMPAGGLAMKSETGARYEARFDGKPYPVTDMRDGTTVTLKRIDGQTIEETIARQGEVVAITRYAAATDGQTLNVEHQYREGGIRGTQRYSATKLGKAVER